MSMSVIEFVTEAVKMAQERWANGQHWGAVEALRGAAGFAADGAREAAPRPAEDAPAYDNEQVVRLAIAAQAGALKLLELIPTDTATSELDRDIDQVTISEAVDELTVATRGALALLADRDEAEDLAIAALDHLAQS